MRRPRFRLTYANVMSTLALLVALGGTASAAVLIHDNSEVAPGTISGHHPPAGDHANIINQSIDTPDIAPGAVGTLKIATGAVTNDLLADGSVTTGKLGDGSVTGGKLAAGAVTGASVLDDSLTGADIDESTLTVKPHGHAGGDLDGSYPNPKIATGAVDSLKVLDASLTGTDIANRGLSDGDFGSPAQVAGADIGSVPANGCLPLQLNFGSWSQIGELVIVNARDGQFGQSGLFFTPLVVTTAGSAFGRVCNVTGAALNPPAEDILAWSIRQ